MLCLLIMYETQPPTLNPVISTEESLRPEWINLFSSVVCTGITPLHAVRSGRNDKALCP